MDKTYDVAVIGAGVFGAWTAWYLARRTSQVALIEAVGPAHTRASSGGETRIIRMGYGADELYTRWSLRSLAQWKELFAGRNDQLFHQTGVLWMGGEDDSRLRETSAVLKRYGVNYHEMDSAELGKRYPQIGLSGVKRAILEPESGVLMARRAVAAAVEDAVRNGAAYHCAQIERPAGSRRLHHITTATGEKIAAGEFVFACGPWLGKIFPDLLSGRIFPTRQEVFFFGIPAGDTRFAPPALPTWLFQKDEVYGMPDIESRGLKIAFDNHGVRIDPDTHSRMTTTEFAEKARAYVAKRFPALSDAPIIQSSVCQYENTSNGDFLIDRHADLENVWFAGGGSGHGFKHGPAVGEYVAVRILDGIPAEPRFSLASKETTQKRTVY